MDGKVVPPDALIAVIAARQHGVISIAQLREIGVSDDAARARVLAGRLHRIHRGVYAVGHEALSHEGRCMAAVLAMGGGPARGESVLDRWGAAVSHRGAAILWGLLPATDAPVDVSVRRGGGRAKRRGIRVHRSCSIEPGHVTLCRGIPATKPARTIADLRWALAVSQPGSVSARELRKAVRQAAVLGLPIEEHAGDRTRSDLERGFLRLCRRHGLPRPEVNVRVGRYLVDFLWRGRRLIVEADGYRFHRGKAAFHDDRKRSLGLIRRGYDVIRLSEDQIEHESDLVAKTLAAALAGSQRDGRPG